MLRKVFLSSFSKLLIRNFAAQRSVILQNKGISPLTPKGGTKKGKKIFISKYKISKNSLQAMLVTPPLGVGGLFVVFTLQFKGSYNIVAQIGTIDSVVFTLQFKGSYNYDSIEL